MGESLRELSKTTVFSSAAANKTDQGLLPNASRPPLTEQWRERKIVGGGGAPPPSRENRRHRAWS